MVLFHSYGLAAGCARVPDDISEKGEFASPEEYKKCFLEGLADERKRLERYKKEWASTESKSDEAGSASPKCPRLSKVRPVAPICGKPGTRLRSHSEPARTGSTDAPWPAGSAPNRRQRFVVVSRAAVSVEDAEWGRVATG